MLKNQQSLIEQLEILVKQAKNKNMKPERVRQLIEESKEVAQELDKAKGLSGKLVSMVEAIYNSKTMHPRRRLKQVLVEIGEHLGVEVDMK